MADNATHLLEQHDVNELDHKHDAGYDYHDHPTDNDDDLCGLHPEHGGDHNPYHDHHAAHHHDRNGSVIYYDNRGRYWHYTDDDPEPDTTDRSDNGSADDPDEPPGDR
jgi:hypothetical protein